MKVLLLDQAILGELLYKSSIKIFYLFPMYETKIALIVIIYSLLMVYPCF